MYRFACRALPAFFLSASLIVSLAVPLAAQNVRNAVDTIHSVSVLESGKDFRLKITGSGAVRPQTQVLTGPNRLVLDFPRALPGRGLRNVSVNSGQVKGVRVGLFASNPPTTRVVVDLTTPQRYEVQPEGDAVIVKVMANGRPIANPPAAPRAPAAPAVASPPPPKVDVEYRNGKLRIVAQRASLAEVLTQVHLLTGAEVSIPPSAGSEQVFATLGPGPPRDVLGALLTGTPFNFIVVSSERDPNILLSVRLSPREGGSLIPANSPSAPVAQSAPAEPTPVEVVPQPEPPSSAQEMPNPPPPDVIPPPPQ